MTLPPHDVAVTPAAPKQTDLADRAPVRSRRPGPRDPAAAYRRIAWLLIALLLLPSGLLIAIGTILMVKGGSPDWNVVLGTLTLVFCGLLATGSVLVWVFIARETGLSQLQTDFVSKVSHELKTPLTSIRLFVETLRLRRTQDPEKVQQCLDLLSQETERLTERIDQLLEWGRMEGGRKVYDLQRDDVNAVVQESVEHFSPAKLQGDAQLEVHLGEGLPPALIDRPALSSAILNLLSNAYKYGGRPRHITLTTELVDHEVYIRVKDNGPGIPLLEHKRIFQKFYRRDDRLSREQEGSGLGLAMVAHIVKGHKGHVEVDSDLGNGATFSLVLPAHRGR